MISNISNIGQEDLNKLTYEFWKNGKEREEITMKHGETLIQAVIFREKIEFNQKRKFIAEALIDFYVNIWAKLG